MRCEFQRHRQIRWAMPSGARWPMELAGDHQRMVRMSDVGGRGALAIRCIWRRICSFVCIIVVELTCILGGASARSHLMKPDRLYLVHLVFGLIPPTRCFRLKRSLLRWSGAKVGEDVRIVSSVRFLLTGRLSIGDGTWIGHEVLIVGGKADVTIGANVDIAARVSIVTGSHELFGIPRAGRGKGLFSSNPYHGRRVDRCRCHNTWRRCRWSEQYDRCGCSCASRCSGQGGCWWSSRERNVVIEHGVADQ